MTADRAAELARRWQIFHAIAPFLGRMVSARFIQRTEETIPGIPRLHNLIEGIYKPSNAHYALSIASMLSNPYADRIAYLEDRSWFFFYSPKAGDLNSAVNQSLFNCMRDGEPLIVLKQLSGKSARQGTTYQLLGLGLIDSFSQSDRLFRIRQVTIDAFHARLDPGTVLKDELIETALQLEALEAWTPFAEEHRALYRVERPKRDAAFRRVVLQNYERTCAVFGSRFVYGGTIEAEAAHIIAKDVNGTDDPRNGLSLSRTAHWAFDQGLFTITDQYEIRVHPKAYQGDNRLFPLLERDRKVIIMPKEEWNCPHPDALKWHSEHCFGRFAREGTHSQSGTLDGGTSL